MHNTSTQGYIQVQSKSTASMHVHVYSNKSRHRWKAGSRDRKTRWLVFFFLFYLGTMVEHVRVVHGGEVALRTTPSQPHPATPLRQGGCLFRRSWGWGIRGWRMFERVISLFIFIFFFTTPRCMYMNDKSIRT